MGAKIVMGSGEPIKRAASLTVVSLLCVWSAAATALDLQVVDIKAFLFLEKTGKLSPNIVGSSKAFFNTIIGEGDSGEPANDVLVDVVLVGDSKATSKSATVTITRPDIKPNPVMKKVFQDLLLQDEKTVVHKAILVENATCGPLRIDVKAGRSSRTAKIEFRCGE